MNSGLSVYWLLLLNKAAPWDNINFVFDFVMK